MSGYGMGGDPDGQNFGLGVGSKDQRTNKETLLKMSQNKRPTGGGATTTTTTNKMPGVQPTK